MTELAIIIIIFYISYRFYKSFSNFKNKSAEQEASISKFSRLIEQDPANPRPYFLRGKTYWELRCFQLASDDYNKALNLNPTNKSFNYNNSPLTFDNSDIISNIKGLNKIKINENEQEISKFSREIEKDPSNPRAYFLRGISYQKYMYIHLAIDDYTKALELNPKNKSFQYNNSSATFDNVTILHTRSTAKKFNKDIIGSKKDLELARQIQI